MGRIKANGTFIFHNVGQGLFYSGKIVLERPFSSHFDFVYDCGVDRGRVTALKTKIKEYKRIKLYDPHHLNMLVISHLHYDHTSGLDELLKNLEVDYVFLPYLFPKERLILSLIYTNASEWYFNFLYDPVTFLIERGVKTVTLIGGKGPEGKGPEGKGPEPIEPKKEEDKLQIELRDDKELEEQIKKSEGDIYSIYKKKEKLLVKSHFGYVKVLNI